MTQLTSWSCNVASHMTNYKTVVIRLFRNGQFSYEGLFVPDADVQCVTVQSE